jgi:hypothetical protein
VCSSRFVVVAQVAERMLGSASAPDLDAIDLDAIKAGDGTLPGGLSPDTLKKLAGNPQVGARVCAQRFYAATV